MLFYDDFCHMTSVLRRRKQRYKRKHLRTLNYWYMKQSTVIPKPKYRRKKWKQKELVTPCSQHERYFIHARLKNENKVSARQTFTMKSDAQPSVTGKLKNIDLIPVYLKSLNGTLQVIQISFRSMESVMSHIEKIECVAKRVHDEYITNESTEKDVRDWLIKEVGLPEEDIEKSKFGYLDGQTILSYEKSSSSELKSELSIPIGMAKR
ncbi:unnamed protein product [Mytilus edulis]|uniref:Uncharacterized protein n=1 Tax=Mytilus edulis TaxID=6550 RepID=A0A8S3UE67_MYTED|nr:unnamed protein product [Mytilus edulis]